jgi:hypothetical protein
MSPYAGGEDILFAYRLIDLTERWALKPIGLFDREDGAARFWRLNEQAFIWLPIGYLASVSQHEFFGHGFRGREFSNTRVTGYSLGVPPPYGNGGGATSLDITPPISSTKLSVLSSAGIEATAILANLTKFHWLENDQIDPHQLFLYLFAQQDITLYIGSMKTVRSFPEEDFSGHDINDYLFSLNATYPSAHLSSSRLRSLSWVNIADPFTFLTAASLLKYLSSGEAIDIPKIEIGDYGFLPSTRMGLTPFGPEFYLESFGIYLKKVIYGYLKGGYHANNRYMGLGFYTPNLTRYVGLRFDTWLQPELLLGNGEGDSQELGAAGSLIIHGKWRGVVLQGEGGYKSIGFLPGYPLNASPTLRLAAGGSF